MKSFSKEKVVVGILQEIGFLDTPGSTEVTVIEKDSAGMVTKARGTTVPSAEAGYALECEFVDTDKTAGTHKLYRNIGTTSSCTFDLAGEIGAADITDESITLADIADNAVLGKLTIYNDTGGTLTAGTLVRVIGYVSTNGLKVEKADADGAKPATHFVPAAINNSASGDIYQLGTLTGYNTNGRTIGDKIYADPTTAGGLTFTAPTGADQIEQQVGVVVTVAASGNIFLFPGMYAITKFGTSWTQDQAINAAKLDSGMFVAGGGLVKDGSNLREGLTIYNATGGSFVAGTLVHVSGYNTTLAPTITLADADANLPATHVVTSTILTLTQGIIAPIAVVTGLNTVGRTIGDKVYLSSTAGEFVFADPGSRPDRTLQEVGVVKVVDAVNGEIQFFPGLGMIKEHGSSYFRNEAVTSPKVNRHDYVEVFEDFMGQALDGTNSPWATKDTSAAGTPTLAITADAAQGELKLQFDATDEAQILTLYGGNNLKFDIDSAPIMDFRFKVNALNANDILVMGLASDQNDTADTVAQNAWFRLEGAGMDLLLESDDGSVDNDDKDSTVNVTGDAYVILRVDVSNKAAVKFYTRSAGQWSELTDGVTTFNMGAYSGNLQPFFQLQKSGGTHTTALTIDYVRVISTRA